MGKAFSDVGVGNGTPMCSRFSLVRRNLLKTSGNSRDTSWGSSNSNSVSGGIRSKTQCVGQGFGDRPLGGALFGAWFFDGSNGGHFKVLGQFGQDGLGLAHPHDQFAAQPPQPGTQVGNALQRNRSRCVPHRGKPAGSVAKISRGSRIHTPTAASSTRNRGWSCTRRFRRNQRSVRMYLFRLHARGFSPPAILKKPFPPDLSLRT